MIIGVVAVAKDGISWSVAFALEKDRTHSTMRHIQQRAAGQRLLASDRAVHQSRA